MPKIWITGARGFIGRNLAKHLGDGGHLVIGLGHGAWPAADAARWGVSHWVNGDVHPGNLRQLARDHGAPPPFIRSDGIAGAILLATAAAIIC